MLQSQWAAVCELAAELERLRHEADEALAIDPPGATWLPEGCEDAPPEVMAQLVAMTAGACKFPADAAVDALWDELAWEARSIEDSRGIVPSWITWHLQQTAHGKGSAEAWESLERWRTVEAALARGLWTEVPIEEAAMLEVYATHLTNDDYIVGAEVLAASLAASGTVRPLVALVSDGVTAYGRATLQRAGWKLLDVGLVGHEGVDSPHSRGFFSKIWLWALPFSRVIYIDTDVLVLRNLDSLFADYKDVLLAATADSQPLMDGVLVTQTGFMVISPSRERFQELWLLCSGTDRPMQLDNWKQYEQGFFTIYFDGGPELDGFGGGCGLGWSQLPAQYNFTVRYCKRPCFGGLGPKNAAIVHFACAKPWDPKSKDFAPAPYMKLYLEFVKIAGIVWKVVDCSSDRACELANEEKLRQIQAQNGAI